MVDAAYEEWERDLMAQPGMVELYGEEAAKSDLWLQLVDARHDLGLTQVQMADRLGVSQAQVARLEKRGYDAYTLNTLRKYVQALGGDYEVVVEIRRRIDTPAVELTKTS